MLCWDVSFLGTQGTEWGFEYSSVILITVRGSPKEIQAGGSFIERGSPSGQINPLLGKSPSLWRLLGPSSLLAAHSLWPLTDSKCQQSQPKSIHHIRLLFKSTDNKWHSQEVIRAYTLSAKTAHVNKTGPRRSNTGPNHPSDHYGSCCNYPHGAFLYCGSARKYLSYGDGPLEKIKYYITCTFSQRWHLMAGDNIRIWL